MTSSGTATNYSTGSGVRRPRPMLCYLPTKATLPSSCMSMLIHGTGKTALAADLADKSGSDFTQ